MNDKEALPFNLTPSSLASVEIMYGFYSAKTGAGDQEIIISGAGKVKLFLTRSMDGPPETREANLSATVIVRLLDVMEGENFFGLEDVYPAHGKPHSRRVIRLTLSDRAKTVALDEPSCPEFERVAGAVKLAAGIALPEALNQRFFPNL